MINTTTSTYHFLGCLTESNIDKTQVSEDIRCGIGNVLKAIIDLSQDVTFTVMSKMHSDHIIETQTGGVFATGTLNAWKHEDGLILATGAFDITGTPLGDIVKVIDKYNKEYVATFISPEVTVVGGTEGASYTCFYQEAEVAADILDFDATLYPENVTVQLHGIAYDPATNLVVSDIYWDFPIVKPDGNLSLAYALATNIQTGITFRAIADALNILGSYAVVDRA